MVGLYIDRLSDEQRDRIIEAKEWTWQFVEVGNPSCRCLVGHAEDYEIFTCDDGYRGSRSRDPIRFTSDAFQRVPRLFNRFGQDRIVALCKARAAKGNRLHELRAEVYRALVPAGGINGRYPEDLR